jgi:hypothetical protein
MILVPSSLKPYEKGGRGWGTRVSVFYSWPIKPGVVDHTGQCPLWIKVRRFSYSILHQRARQLFLGTKTSWQFVDRCKFCKSKQGSQYESFDRSLHDKFALPREMPSSPAGTLLWSPRSTISASQSPTCSSICTLTAFSESHLETSSDLQSFGEWRCQASVELWGSWALSCFPMQSLRYKSFDMPALHFSLHPSHPRHCSRQSFIMRTSQTTLALLSKALAVSAAPQLLGTVLGGGDNPQIALDYGTFRGIHAPVTGTDNFLGMPFAVSGRLQNPRVIDAQDKLSRVQDATKYGTACPQQELTASPLYSGNAQLGALLATVEELTISHIDQQGEDCLNMNVPRSRQHDPRANREACSMMWIHSGGFELGSSAALGSEATALPGIIYQGANIVKRSVEMGQPVVFVSANHRLNGFGTLAFKRSPTLAMETSC